MIKLHGPLSNTSAVRHNKQLNYDKLALLYLYQKEKEKK